MHIKPALNKESSMFGTLHPVSTEESPPSGTILPKSSSRPCPGRHHEQTECSWRSWPPSSRPFGRRVKYQRTSRMSLLFAGRQIFVWQSSWDVTAGKASSSHPHQTHHRLRVDTMTRHTRWHHTHHTCCWQYCSLITMRHRGKWHGVAIRQLVEEKCREQLEPKLHKVFVNLKKASTQSVVVACEISNWIQPLTHSYLV